MVGEIVVEEDLVDEAGVALPVIFFLRLGEREMPREVLILGRNRVEVFDVERFAKAPRPVPVGDLTLGVNASKLIEDMRAHRSHAGATADENHLIVRVLGEEFAEGARDGDFVTGLEIEDVGGHQSGRYVG